MVHYGRALVGLVADAGVVGEGNPPARSHDLQPVFIGTIGREVIPVPLDREACGLQDLREKDAEVAVSEEDIGQAARS